MIAWITADPELTSSRFPTVQIMDTAALGKDGASAAFREAAAMLADSWRPVILCYLAGEDGIEFETIEAAFPAVSEATLSETLSDLESNQLVDRVEVSKHPPQIEYVTTERGTALAAICEQLAAWCESATEPVGNEEVAGEAGEAAEAAEDASGESSLHSEEPPTAHETETASETTAESASETAPETEVTEQPVVLLADDNPDMITMLEQWLSDGYAVRTAADGTEAIEQLDSEIDIAVLDRKMPEMSGDTVLEAIRSAGYDMQVVMVTGEPPTEELLEMPFDEYLTKPVEQDAFLETIEEMLERSEYDDQLQEFLARKSKADVIEPADEE